MTVKARIALLAVILLGGGALIAYDQTQSPRSAGPITPAAPADTGYGNIK